MSFENWVFYRSTVGTPLLLFDLSDVAPMKDTSSLILQELGTPSEETVAFRSLAYGPGLSSGSMETAFLHNAGAGFKEYGIYFYASNVDPTGPTVQCYEVSIPDAFTDIRIYECFNGIATNTRNIIHAFTSPILTNTTEPILIRVSWYGGIFLTTFGGLRIKVEVAVNSILESNFVTLSPPVTIPSPFTNIKGEGIYVRSKDMSEPLSQKLDHTIITQILPQT